MDSLRASLAARGQQVPIEVVAQKDGRFGLISGLRRVLALRALASAEVLAIVRPPQSSSAAYLAMVEENEIRAGISFYERARLAAKAADLGIFGTPSLAIAELFASASPAKRSKIGSFVQVHKALGEDLRFPTSLSERLGLELAARCKEPGFIAGMQVKLAQAMPENAQQEREVLEAALRATDQGEGGATASRATARAMPKKAALSRSIGQGLTLKAATNTVTLFGAEVTQDLITDLEAWLRNRLKD